MCIYIYIYSAAVFPGITAGFVIFEPRYRLMVRVEYIYIYIDISLFTVIQIDIYIEAPQFSPARRPVSSYLNPATVSWCAWNIYICIHIYLLVSI